MFAKIIYIMTIPATKIIPINKILAIIINMIGLYIKYDY